MPELAKSYTVIAVDQRGIGLSDKPAGGYDSGNIAMDLASIMTALGHARFAVAGHDTGMVASYALAADYPDRVARVALMEVPGPPSFVASPPAFLPGVANNKLWHIPFNRIGKTAEQLITGREDIFFGYEFNIQGGTLPQNLVDYYISLVSDPAVPVRKPRLLPRLRRHPGPERRTRQDPAADAGPGHRRSPRLGHRSGRTPGRARHHHPDRRGPRRRTLGRRAGAGRTAREFTAFFAPYRGGHRLGRAASRSGSRTSA